MSQDLLNGIGAQPTPQPVIKKRPCEMNDQEKKQYNKLRNKNYREKNLAKVSMKFKQWYAAKMKENPNYNKECNVKRVDKNPNCYKEAYSRRIKKNPNCYNEYRAGIPEYHKRQYARLIKNNPSYGKEKMRALVKSLDDNYLKNLLYAKGIKLFTEELLQVTRLRLFLKRFKLDKLDENQKQQLTNMLNQFKGELKCT